jgi:hypothetical protein
VIYQPQSQLFIDEASCQLWALQVRGADALGRRIVVNIEFNPGQRSECPDMSPTHASHATATGHVLTSADYPFVVLRVLHPTRLRQHFLLTAILPATSKRHNG